MILNETDSSAAAARAAFLADGTAELDHRVRLYRHWLLDIARNPKPHHDASFVGTLSRGLELILAEIERRARPQGADRRDPFAGVRRSRRSLHALALGPRRI